MNFLFLDAETYYDSKTYTLRKMTPAEYILDSRFEEMGWATRANGGPREWINAEDFPHWLRQYPAEKTITVTYNSLFDNCILGWMHSYVPFRMIDGLGMARACLGHKLRSLSLAKVAEHMGIGLKGTTIAKVDGLRAADIKAKGLWSEYTNYALQDIILLEGIYDGLVTKLPKVEYRVMDLVLRACVQPRFMIDRPLLQQHIDDLRASKEKLMQDANAQRAQLMSTNEFCKLLEERGVEVALKESPAGKMIPALAKTDEFMASLAEHEDPEVQALAAARLGMKSTLEETRGQRLLDVSGLDWSTYRDGNPRFYSGGTMPIPLRYAGAHTHRLSGDWRMNMQNLPSSRKELSRLRKSLVAPPGHKVIVTDFGQIEARLTAWICKATYLFGQFKRGEDPYKQLAMAIFHLETVELVSELQRFIGKSGVLGLGFGAGAEKFYAMVIRTARSMGWDIPKLKEVWTLGLSHASVTTYREKNQEIVACWKLLEEHLRYAWMGLSGEAKFGPVTIGDHLVRGPNGLEMLYERAPLTGVGGNLKYLYAGQPHIIYGSKFLENIIQFLARILLMNAALRLKDRGLPFALQAHDELAFIVPDADVDAARAIIKEEMLRPASWASDLPLTASVSPGVNSYGEAK